MRNWSHEFLSQNADDTAELALKLGNSLRAPAVICLEGPVGSGKTHFARALIQSILIEPEDVPSPTFTLVQEYDSKLGAVWHSDLYRITSEEEIEELGLIDAFNTAICLIEWPEKLGTLKPQDALTLRFSSSALPDQRIITACADPNSPWPDLIEKMRND